MRNKGGRFGFTLIELLVVIAIIAILASILFPVFMTAKQKSYEATCSSSLKQFANAFSMYTGDWGRLPLPGGSNQPNGTAIPAWIHSSGSGNSIQTGGIWPYIRSRINPGARGSVWSCPLAAPVTQDDVGYGFSPGANYVMNDYIRAAHPGEGDWGNKTAGYWVGLSPEQCATPSKVILLFEAVQNRHGFVNRLGSPYYVLADFPHRLFHNLAAYIPQNYHDGKSNFLMIDGHVRAMYPDNTWTAACRNGVKDNISNFTGYRVDTAVTKVYPGCGDTDYWNPRTADVLYP